MNPDNSELPSISIVQYEEAKENNTGWCKACEDFTTDCVEPDAEDYECDICGESSVVGAENALLMECFELTGEIEE